MPRWVDFQTLMSIENELLGALLDGSSDEVSLPLEMKIVAMAVEDLRTLVSVSTLHSRWALARSLGELAKTANDAGRVLGRFNSGVMDTLDSLLLSRPHVLHTLERTTLMPSTHRLQVLQPLSNEVTHKGPTMRTFTDLISSLSMKVERLSLGLRDSLEEIARMEDRHASIVEMIQSDAALGAGDEADVLSDLWTVLGGDRLDPKIAQQTRARLQDVSQHEFDARAYMASAGRAVDAASKQLRDLCEHVSTPPSISEIISTESHVKSIKDSLERLSDRRARVVKRRLESSADRVLGRRV
ncbi:hypothetical protein BC834DRAFT_832729 [Gloeopeniophorella convolvens]|nr:hypothetical protein BC834DRAFT_832729 [Gloeopeniophorella convolvens]